MTDLTPKNYPPAAAEVSKIFGLDAESRDSGHSAGSETAPAAHAVGNLPVANLPVAAIPVPQPKAAKFPADADAHGGNGAAASVKERLHEKLEKLSGAQDGAGVYESASSSRKWLSIARIIGMYLAVFAIGIAAYFFFFSNINFGGLIKFQPKASSPQESALMQLEKNSTAAYGKWIAGFYYDVSDDKVLDPNADNSGNGLTNFQKYLLNLNPRSYDTLGLGMADSQALAEGINPLTGSRLTEDQQSIVNTYFDMEVVMNRLTLAKMQHSGSVAGANIAQAAGAANSGQTPQGPAGGSNAIPYVQTGGAAYANDLDIDMNVPGRLQVPSLKIDAPLIWSSDPGNFEDDLKKGVIHYPGTALPGQIGTTYISGHSSNYAWAKGNYNHIFTHLGDLKDNASFEITVTLKGGKQVTLHYVVTGRKEYQPDDQVQFINSGSSIVNLSTCWPIGTTQKRLVVTGQLVQVDR